MSTAEGLPTSNLPFRGGKGWLYDGGVREPLIIRWPNVIKAKTTCDTPVMSIDFLPTAFAAAGAQQPSGKPIDGCNLLPLLKSGMLPERDALYWHYPHYSNQGGFPGGAIRMGDWKLIERFENGQTHLYNLRDDVGEKNDLNAARPQKTAELKKRLHEWYKETGARFLEQNEAGPAPWRPDTDNFNSTHK